MVSCKCLLGYSIPIYRKYHQPKSRMINAISNKYFTKMYYDLIEKIQSVKHPHNTSLIPKLFYAIICCINWILFCWLLHCVTSYHHQSQNYLHCFCLFDWMKMSSAWMPSLSAPHNHIHRLSHVALDRKTSGYDYK